MECGRERIKHKVTKEKRPTIYKLKKQFHVDKYRTAERLPFRDWLFSPLNILHFSHEKL